MTRAKIQQYLERVAGVRFSNDPGDANPETNLFESGFMDSFAFLQLVTFLEKEFAIKITTAEAMSPQLLNLAGIESFVETKRARTGT